MASMLQHLLIASFFSTLCFACGGHQEHHHKGETVPPNGAFHAPTTIPLSPVGFYCGILDSKGNLWFGTRGNGVFRYNEAGFTHYSTENGLIHNNISCIAEDHDGNLWFGTPIGACKYDGAHFSQLQIPQSDTSSLWLDKVYPVVNPNEVSSILEDSGGNLWLGTNGAGVYRYSEGAFTQHLQRVGMVYEDGQQHNIVLSMAEDQDRNVWFSSLSHGGVSKFDGQTFTHYVDELSDDFIRVVYPDSKGNMWIGTHGNHEGGLDKFDGQQFNAFFKTDAGFEHNNVRWIHEDDSGLLWLGSGTTELATFDGTTFSLFRDQNGNGFHHILFVIGDVHGDIWFGNFDGLWRYDGQKVQGMDLVPSLEIMQPVPANASVVPPDAQLIFHSPPEDYWLANERFLFHVTSSSIKRFDMKESLPDNHILGVQSGIDGRIFFDTPKGVSAFDGNSFVELSIDTLSARKNAGLSTTESLWFRGGWEHAGPLLYNGISLQVVPFPTSPLEKAFRKNYPHAGFNPYAIFCQYKAQDGSTWFGTSDMGIYHFNNGHISWMHAHNLSTTPEGGTFGIRSMTEDGEGNFWINQIREKYKIDLNVKERSDVDRITYQRLAGITDGEQRYFMQMNSDTLGNVWMLDSGELWKWDGTIFSQETITFEGTPVIPTSMYRDALGTIWISTKENGVFRRTGNQPESWRSWNY